MAYTPATPAQLKQYYPAFASVPDATVQFWLDDARTTVTDCYDDDDRAKAEMALAAHNMAIRGIGGPAGGGGSMASLAAAGVSSFKSASMSVDFETGRSSVAQWDYGATMYGSEYLLLLKRNCGGTPFLSGGCC